MSSIEFGKAIHQHTDDRFFITRFCSSIYSIGKEKGRLAGGTAALAATTAAVVSLGISYFCIDGTWRSLVETSHGTDPYTTIRPFGDAGGWTALAIFSITGLGTFLAQLIREGEYLRLKSICEEWINENQLAILEENSKFKSQLYKKVSDILDAFSAHTLFTKSLSSRKLTALSIIKNSGLAEENKKLKLDRQLEDILQRVQSDLDAPSCARGYFQKVFEGGRSIKKQGCCRLTGSVILGIAIPIILLSTAVLSVIGEVGLGKQLFVDREDLPEVGHFGEWPFNALEVVGVAFFLHLWCVINEGDLAITRNIYEKHLRSVKDQPKLHKRLKDIANKHLLEDSNGCHFFKHPADFQF